MKKFLLLAFLALLPTPSFAEDWFLEPLPYHPEVKHEVPTQAQIVRIHVGCFALSEIGTRECEAVTLRLLHLEKKLERDVIACLSLRNNTFVAESKKVCNTSTEEFSTFLRIKAALFTLYPSLKAFEKENPFYRT
jgi:hypothetical protein